MVITIPTYLVRVKNNYSGEKDTYRCPQTKLENFISVLIFNNLEFEVELERRDEPGRIISGTDAE